MNKQKKSLHSECQNTNDTKGKNEPLKNYALKKKHNNK